MTLIEAITRTQTLKPSQYSIEEMAAWISELENKIYKEYGMWHEGALEVPMYSYDPVADADTVLMVPDPYSDVYIKYLQMQIDYHNAEYNRYNQSTNMYNTALSAYVDWLTRNYMPKQECYVRC